MQINCAICKRSFIQRGNERCCSFSCYKAFRNNPEEVESYEEKVAKAQTKVNTAIGELFGKGVDIKALHNAVQELYEIIN